ncbi:polysaccharide deacetylase family protein [Leeuwenhoekiella sp. W20_SRS_FM14]|uniref:polysaccharide deacetylase family protein n=1 Tax=Leeuwenhoekiella sp. W20_SRS_FM14 TaxID=3240270 RepID=UPI003F9ACFDD
MFLKFNLPVKTPKLVKRLYSKYIWDKIITNDSQKVIYLTFDDGPIPEVTPWVIDTLKAYNAKATFFCIGENVFKNPTTFEYLKKSGNSIGNHTYNHLNGWKTETTTYISNFLKAEAVMESKGSEIQKIFRPPYGKITKKQAENLIARGYDIIMYDVIAHDWEHNITKELCLKNVLNNTVNGSIVVFHDSLKAEKNMRYTLPKVLKHFSELGYEFKGL